MKTKYLLRLLFLLAIFAVIAGIIYYFLLSPKQNENDSLSTATDNLLGWKYPVTKFPSTGTSGQLAYSSIRDPGGIPQGLPVRLKIPAIGVDSAIEDALITADGRMDVPAGSVNVAWFSLGPQPGQVGSAVIGGHYGVNHDIPFVFYKLDQVKIGDKLYIIDDESNTLEFVVKSIKSFDRNADATTVFTSDDGLSHLNLITCEGIWNQVNGSYPLRLVVFSDAVIAEGTNTLSISSALTFTRSLSVGLKGADVVLLQDYLEEKGFLTMPIGVSKGFFGWLTRNAVAKYQTSVGLPSVGVFGPLTIAKLVSEVVAG